MNSLFHQVRKRTLIFIPALFIGLLWSSCTKDKIEEPEPFVNDLENPDFTVVTTIGTAEFFNENLVDDNYVLVNDARANRVYMMDKRAEVLYEWDLSGKGLGNDAFLESDGKLLTMLDADNVVITLGGQGGLIRILDKDGNVEWEYTYNSNDYVAHHDALLLPNGNVLFQSWERKTAAEAEQAGSNLNFDLFPDALIEVNTTTNQIVWEWHVWDHLVQDHDATKDNFGVVAENPQLINLNYVNDPRGDITHANGIDYDATNDFIYLSVNFFSEVWVIDHSTTTQQAASHAGGNSGKGGDLVYRFGNPAAYGNTQGTALFDNNHHPNLLTGADEGRIMMFSNGKTALQSTAYELLLPSPLRLQANTNNEPTVLWSFTNEDLYAARVSGVVKLPNGNRLIAEGDYGYWEVSERGEVVWRFQGAGGFYWRGYHYDKDAPEVQGLGI